MKRKTANLLEVGDAIFLGPEKIRSTVVKVGSRCRVELFPPELRQHVEPKEFLEIFVKLARRTIIETTGYPADFFTVFLDSDRIVRVVERDSQPAAR